MFRKREYIALPVGWKERYGTDKESEVPGYVKRNTRGVYFSCPDVVPCMFSNKEEADRFDREHLKHYLLRQKFADWWMPTEPEMIEIDPDTLEEVPFVPTQKWIDSHPEFSNEKLQAEKPYIWITTKIKGENEERNIFIPI